MAFSILEYAANVRQKKLDLDRAITDLRHKNPSVEWTQYAIAVEDNQMLDYQLVEGIVRNPCVM